MDRQQQPKRTGQFDDQNNPRNRGTHTDVNNAAMPTTANSVGR